MIGMIGRLKVILEGFLLQLILLLGRFFGFSSILGVAVTMKFFFSSPSEVTKCIFFEKKHNLI